MHKGQLMQLLSSTLEYINQIDRLRVSGEEEPELLFLEGQRVAPFLMAQWHGAVSVRQSDLFYSGILSKLGSYGHNDAVIDASSIDNLLVYDIGGQFSEKFGLPLTRIKNRTRIKICNPGLKDEIEDFPDYLFNHAGPTHEPVFYARVHLDKANFDESVNMLFARNGFSHATFTSTEVSRMELEGIMQVSAKSNVMVYSERSPTVPYDIAQEVARASRLFPKAKVLLFPYFNTRILDGIIGFDPVFQRMTKAYESGLVHDVIANSVRKPGHDINFSALSRDEKYYHALSLYYCLEIASVCNSSVYINKENPELNFNKPLFIVTNLK